MERPDSVPTAKSVLARIRAMGIEARLMDGNRCVLASMRFQCESLASVGSMLQVDRVLFSTVGPDRLKCLHPRALMQLPLIRYLDCQDSTAIEARIRLTWREHITELKKTRAWLESIGCEVESAEDGSILTFPIDGENRRARVSMINPLEVILPSRGHLSGLSLQRIEDRCLRIDRTARSSVELEIEISTRLEELRRLDQRLTDERRRVALSREPTTARPSSTRRQRHLLLVGPRISQERGCIESLRLRGYHITAVQSEQDGIAAFKEQSPELVLADFAIGRSDGTSLILALRQIAGIEEIPVILIDTSQRATSREAARRLGAAGYLVYPIAVQRISDRLAKMVSEPRRRRFTRYSRRLPIEVEGANQPCMVTSLGRGGMFVATDDSLASNSLRQCEVTLPEMGRVVSFEAEVVYQRGSRGRNRGGVGVRYNSFNGSDENILINYLQRTCAAIGP